MKDLTKEDLYHLYKLFELVRLAYPSYLLDGRIEYKIKSILDSEKSD